MKFKGLSGLILLVAIAMATAGCSFHRYRYSLDTEFLGLADCEITLSMKSVDYDQMHRAIEGDKTFVFKITYQCLTADPSQRLELKNVLVTTPDGLVCALKLMEASTLKGGYNVLEYGLFYRNGKRSDSVKVSFDLIVPEGVAVGAPRSGHYETLGLLRDDKVNDLLWKTAYH